MTPTKLLDETQRSNLVRLAREWLVTQEFDDSHFQQSEKQFTGNVLLPRLKQFVQSLNKPSLFVRGDGGTPMLPVVWSGISFIPDLAICEFDQKYLAIEVKFLRGNQGQSADPGGALTKAIGQTSMYSRLGYDQSFGLIIDLRSTKVADGKRRWNSILIERSDEEVHVFK